MQEARPRRRALVVGAVSVALVVASAGAALAASTDFFEPVSSPEPAGTTPIAVAAGDLDGDARRRSGRREPAARTTSRSSRTTAPATSSSPPTAPSRAAMSRHRWPLPTSTATADLDLVVGNQASDDLTYLRNSGSGQLRPARVRALRRRGPIRSRSPPPTSTATAMSTSRSRNNVASGTVTILKNNGAGELQPARFEPRSRGIEPGLGRSRRPRRRSGPRPRGREHHAPAT